MKKKLRDATNIWTLLAVAILVSPLGLTQYFVLLRIRGIETRLAQLQSRSGASAQVAPLPVRPVSLTGAATKGNRAAKVALLEYTDFQCPFCRKVAVTVLPEIVRRYVDTGLVLLAFKNLPLDNIHQFARGAAEAARCAGRQGHFWDMHDLLFLGEPRLDREALLANAHALHLKEDVFTSCLSSDVTREVQDEVLEAKALAITGTPTFLIGEIQSGDQVRVLRRASGVQTVDAIGSMLDALVGAASNRE